MLLYLLVGILSHTKYITKFISFESHNNYETDTKIIHILQIKKFGKVKRLGKYHTSIKAPK